jgi:hypothetical protein
MLQSIRLQHKLFLVSFVLASVLTYWLYQQQEKYFETHPYFYDGATYQTQHIELAQKAEKEGFFSAFVHNILHNPKQPLRPGILLLFPQLLKNTIGYILLLIPMLTWFFNRLACLILLRTKHLPTALLSALIFTSFGVIYDPFLGLGGYWLDFFAGILLSCAIIEFRFFELKQEKKYLIHTGFFLAMCGLSRYEAYLYEFVVLGPVLLSGIISRTAEKIQDKIKLLGLVAMPLIVFSAFHILKHMSFIYDYNTKLNYGLGKDLKDSIWYIRTGLLKLANPGFIFLLLILPIWGFIQNFKNKTPNSVKDIIKGGWMCLSMPLLWSLVMGISGTGANYFMLFVFPVFIVSVLGWWPLPSSPARSMTIGLIALGIFFSLEQVYSYHKSSSLTNLKVQNTLMIQDGFISSNTLVEGANVAPLFTEDTHPLYLRIYSKTGTLPPPVDSLVFSFHTNYYPANYETENPDTLCILITDFLKRKVNYTIALENPQIADTSSQYTEKLPRIMAAKLSESVLSDTAGWKKIHSFPSILFGNLIILQNRNPEIQKTEKWN